MMEPEDVRRFERHVKTLGKAAGDDPAAFAQAVTIIDGYREVMQAAVAELQAQGFTWNDIAAALGVSRQSAWRKYRVG